MDTTPDKRPTTALVQLGLAEAAALARRGRHEQAARLIEDLLACGPPNAAALDLLARVRAQRGALREAEDLWRRALELEPGHAGATAGLRRIRCLWARPAFAALPTSLIAFGAGALALVLLLSWSNRRQAREIGRIENVFRAEVSATAAEVEGLGEEIRSLAEAQAKLAQHRDEIATGLGAVVPLREKVAGVAAAADRLNGATLEVSRQVGQLADQLSALRKDQQTATAQLKQLGADVAGIDALRKEVAEVAAGHDTLKLGLRSLAERQEQSAKEAANRAASAQGSIEESVERSAANIRAAVEELLAAVRANAAPAAPGAPAAPSPESTGTDSQQNLPP